MQTMEILMSPDVCGLCRYNPLHGKSIENVLLMLVAVKVGNTSLMHTAQGTSKNLKWNPI